MINMAHDHDKGGHQICVQSCTSTCIQQVEKIDALYDANTHTNTFNTQTHQRISKQANTFLKGSIYQMQYIPVYRCSFFLGFCFKGAHTI